MCFRCTHCSWSITAPRYSQWPELRECMYVRIHTYLHTLTSVSQYIENHEFIPVPQILIYHHRVHSNVLSFYICTSLSLGKLTLPYLYFIYLKSPCMQTVFCLCDSSLPCMCTFWHTMLGCPCMWVSSSLYSASNTQDEAIAPMNVLLTLLGFWHTMSGWLSLWTPSSSSLGSGTPWEVGLMWMPFYSCFGFKSPTLGQMQ